MQATLGLLHEVLALGAPLPLLPLGHLHQQQVLLAPVPLAELLVRRAVDAGVPRHGALRAEEAPAARALRLGDGLAGVVQHHRRAVLERAVRPRGGEHHGLAQRRAPPVEHLPREDPLAELRVERAAAPLLGAPDVGDPLLDLGADVAREARRAEGVVAPAARAVRGGRRHGVHADLAEDERRRGGGGDRGQPRRRRRGVGGGALTYEDNRPRRGARRGGHHGGRHDHLLELQLGGVLLVGYREELAVVSIGGVVVVVAAVGEDGEVEVVDEDGEVGGGVVGTGRPRPTPLPRFAAVSLARLRAEIK